MQENTAKIKRIVLLAALACIVLLLFSIYKSYLHHGLTKVTVTAIPSDSNIYLNDKAISTGDNYIKPGSYTFTAKHAGYTNDDLQVTVTKATTTVDLIPVPSSAEADAFLKDHPDIALAREAIGGKRANARGAALEKQNSLITKLPYTDTTGPFTIDYGPSLTRKDGVFLVVRNSSPDGRQNALKWIREQGYTPADYEIQFKDFINPLLSVGDTR